MVRCGRPAVFVWFCKLRTIEDHVLCHATVVSSIKSKPRNLGVCTLYTIGESVQCIHSLLYILDDAVTINTSRRTAAGRLVAFLVHLLTNVPCKQDCLYATNNLTYYSKHELGLSTLRRVFLFSSSVCVCLFSSHLFWTSSSLDVPAAMRPLIFLARRIQPFLSLVDREVDFCVRTIRSFSTRWAFFIYLFIS